MPHGTGINKTFELVFIGIQEHTDEGIYVINLPVGGDDGARQGIFSYAPKGYMQKKEEA
jgi:hypothetical protein